MQILNFGSLNIDHVYTVDHFVAPGETLLSADYQINAGGKGLNQSIALARAGVAVSHAGMIGGEGVFLKELLSSSGVDVENVITDSTPTGHAIIQVEKSSGENSILLYPGANMQISTDRMQNILRKMPQGSWLLLQNEINDIPFLIENAKDCGLKGAINPAPCTELVRSYPLHLCDLIIVNEIEAACLAACEGSVQQHINTLANLFPESELVVTLGKKGAVYRRGDVEIAVPARVVKAVDTTSAGDTFTGYFLASKLRGMDAQTAMEYAVFASSITVSRHGAAVSIPTADEVFQSLPEK